MTSFTNRIKPDSTELERYFLSVYTGNLWNALEKIKDWHSPEYIEKEVQMKLLKIQHQPLPFVPKFVAEFLSGDENELSKADRIAYLLKSVEGDNYYLEKYLTSAGIISQEQGEHLYDWATNQTHETVLELWNGYMVQKPKRFYLKHIDMSKADKELDYYLAKEGDGTLSHDMPNKGQFPWHPESRFTQQEIDSMQTGSYKKIEVEK